MGYYPRDPLGRPDHAARVALVVWIVGLAITLGVFARMFFQLVAS